MICGVLGSYAFQNCESLTEIVIPASVAIIGEYAFNGCVDLIIKYQGATIPSTWDYNWNVGNNIIVYLGSN